MLAHRSGYYCCALDCNEKNVAETDRLGNCPLLTAGSTGVLRACTARLPGPVSATLTNQSQSEIVSLVALEKEVFDECAESCPDDEQTTEFAICGLHCCGGLSSSTLSAFVHGNATTLCLVGCCYNLLAQDERCHSGTAKIGAVGAGNATRANGSEVLFTQAEDVDDGPCDGFPMSNMLRDDCVSMLGSLTRNSLQLATASIHNANPEDAGVPQHLTPDALQSVAYRAAFQSILIDVLELPPTRKRIGNPKKLAAAATFAEYAKIALGTLGLLDSLVEQSHWASTDAGLMQHWEELQPALRPLPVFTAFQLLLSPLIEIMILLDRVLYCQDGGAHAMLLQIFDAAISPRNRMIVATKSSNTFEQLKASLIT